MSSAKCRLRCSGLTGVFLLAGDSSTDKPIQTASPMYVVWAKGGLNEFGVVTKHSERLTGTTAAQSVPVKPYCVNSVQHDDSVTTICGFFL